MRTLAIIQAHKACIQFIEPYYYAGSKCDLAGVSGNDSKIEPSEWPSVFKHIISVGPLDGRVFDLHARRIVEMFEWALSTDYDAFVATEYDSAFFREPPEPTDGVGCWIAGYCDPRWKCGDGPFLHPPFHVSRVTARRIVDVGRDLLERRIIGNGTPDVFLGLVCTEGEIPIDRSNVYSCNALDMRIAEKMVDARNHFKRGVWHIHGIKRRDHYDFITGKTDQYPPDTFFRIP